MNKMMLWRIILCFVLACSLFLSVEAQENLKVQLSRDVFIEKIDDGVWRHVSHKKLSGTESFPSNGLIIQFGTRVIVVDTAWNDNQTKLILNWIERKLKSKPSSIVITHYHEDRLGGIREVHRRGIQVIASELTVKLAKQRGLKPPAQSFKTSTTLSLDEHDVQVLYLGPGHTVDNVVVWLPGKQILFGGCLIKSAEADDLGNTKDADLNQWPLTVEQVHKDFRRARMVIPGHGDVGGIETVTRTLELLKASRNASDKE